MLALLRRSRPDISVYMGEEVPHLGRYYPSCSKTFHVKSIHPVDPIGCSLTRLRVQLGTGALSPNENPPKEEDPASQDGSFNGADEQVAHIGTSKQNHEDHENSNQLADLSTALDLQLLVRE